VVNLHGSYTIGKHAEIFARLVNLFDREYSTAGFLGRNAFTASGSFIPAPVNWTNENALSPAEPRALWAGVRIRLK
jgi:iron complex outermembrane recepter protein